MTPFIELNTEQQALQIKILSISALKKYGFEKYKIKLIRHEMNTIFFVEVEDDKVWAKNRHPNNTYVLFAKDQATIFSKATVLIEKKLERLGTTEDQFGFVHGDYYFRNILINDGEISAIDFDLCGFGYYIYDIIMPYWPRGQGNLNEAYEYYLMGYARVRKLPEGILEYRDTFIALRRLMDAYWIVSREDHPLLKSLIFRIVANSAIYLKEYKG